MTAVHFAQFTRLTDSMHRNLNRYELGDRDYLSTLTSSDTIMTSLKSAASSFISYVVAVNRAMIAARSTQTQLTAA